MSKRTPHIIAVAGPNGAGKSSRAPQLLRDTFSLMEYVNADTIAQGLSAFRPETMAMMAGRIMLERLQRLVEAQESFAFETTLSGRAHARWVRRGKESQGYEFHIMFFWLRSPELAIQRVRQRVREGGHSIPSDVIVRRYISSVRNFFGLYQALANSWGVYDNSVYNDPRLLAVRVENSPPQVYEESLWKQFCKVAE